MCIFSGSRRSLSGEVHGMCNCFRELERHKPADSAEPCVYPQRYHVEGRETIYSLDLDAGTNKRANLVVWCFVEKEKCPTTKLEASTFD